jgi:hypothetical protein
MMRVHDVKLELVRPGPPHNQLLSPLTPYMALCGEGSPVTFHIDYEHRQLLNRLERLRYIAPDGKGGFVSVPERLREAQVYELGDEIGDLLSRIPSLNSELARARGSEAGDSEFVHLRLVLSGSELSILPFELARAPQAFPGEGLDFSLQGSLPIVVTREIRRSRPLAARWDARDPKVLFIAAAPAGLTVPLREHARALRNALDPWIEWPDTAAIQGKPEEEARLPLVKERLRVLSGASIQQIYETCAKESFTHVHILAHGATYPDAGEERFGVALHRQGRPDEKHVVGGKQLAQALRAEGQEGADRSEPLIVTLAICDSGQQGSVLVPGGSIAHDLHTEGIPWVFASQFPLTKTGSVRIAEFLYPRLLRGDDPRQVLYELRRTLSMRASGEHDWASLVTYAALEGDFDYRVAQFFERQTTRAIEVLMSKADRLVAARGRTNRARDGAKVDNDQAKATLREVSEWLSRWEKRMPPAGGTLRERTTRTNCFGTQGSTFKRIGLLHASLGEHDLARQELHRALDAYRRATDEWVTDDARYSWTASQSLALSAVLKEGTKREKSTYTICRRLAERDLDSANTLLRAWAHATLAELDLLSSVYDAQDHEVIRKEVLKHCDHIVALAGTHSFPAESTRRQFERYATGWGQPSTEPDPGWKKIARDAATRLGGG